MGGRKKENVTRRVQPEATWRSELEKKIKNEKRDKLREWEEERMKEDEARKKQLEENWKIEWDKKMDGKETEKSTGAETNERQLNWEAAMRKCREEEHHDRLTSEKAWLTQIKQRREREDKERAERNEKWTEKVDKRAKEDEEYVVETAGRLADPGTREIEGDCVVAKNCG